MKYLLALLMVVLPVTASALTLDELRARLDAHERSYNARPAEPVRTQPQANSRYDMMDVLLMQNLLQSNRQAFQPTIAPSNGYQIVPVPRSLSCQSFTSGSYINTNCY